MTTFFRRGCFALSALMALTPPAFWAGTGLAGALAGRGPAFGPEALLAALWAGLALGLGWLGWPAGFGPALPDGLLEAAQTTKALPPDERRGELCSSNVSNQS